MPHDIHGRKIEAGDVVKGFSYATQKKEVLKVQKVFEGTDTCNLFAHHFDVREAGTSLNAKEAELVLKADGSEPEAIPPK